MAAEGSDSRSVTIPSWDDRLDDIARSEEAKFRLKVWNKSLEMEERAYDRQEKRKLSAKSDLYQVMGIYLVFQGVILGAVSRSKNMDCRHFTVMLILCAIALFVAIISSVAHLRERLLAMERLTIANNRKKVFSKLIADFQEKHPQVEALSSPQADDHFAEGTVFPEGGNTVSNWLFSWLKKTWLFTWLKAQFSNWFFTWLKAQFWNWVFAYAGVVIAAILAFGTTNIFAKKKKKKKKMTLKLIRKGE